MSRQVRYFLLLFFFSTTFLGTFAQDNKSKIEDKKSEKRQRISSMVKQQEEGVLSYRKQSVFGIELRTNGYGGFYELGRSRSPKATNIYSLEVTEIKNRKEDKLGGDNFFANSFVFGKINNFYQAKLGFGQQIVLGQKGNKNGVAVLAIMQGGLSIGLLKPYYVDVLDAVGQTRSIKYDSKDSTLFLDRYSITGGSGLFKGWSEVKIKPGLYAKAALRFDFGRYNESVQALEIGMSLDAYADRIPLLVYNDPKRLFFQGHIAFVFGRRK
jgi:hypothetical protein